MTGRQTQYRRNHYCIALTREHTSKKQTNRGEREARRRRRLKDALKVLHSLNAQNCLWMLNVSATLSTVQYAVEIQYVVRECFIQTVRRKNSCVRTEDSRKFTINNKSTNRNQRQCLLGTCNCFILFNLDHYTITTREGGKG